MNTRNFRDIVHKFSFGYQCAFGFDPNESTTKNYVFSNGIEGFVSCRGTVLFDFHKCKITPIVVTPESLWNTVDRSDIKACENVSRKIEQSYTQEKLNRQYAQLIVSAHKLCLTSAFVGVSGISLSIDQEDSQGALVSGYKFFEIAKEMPERTHKWKNADEAMILLEKVISHKFEDLLNLFHLYRVSYNRLVSWHFAESLVVSWTICERIINRLWEEYLNEQNKDNPERFISSRLSNLKNSKDYNSAVKLEFLELYGKISHKMYKDFCDVRSVRNKWLHSMKPVKEKSSADALAAAAQAINLFSPEEISPCGGGIGGYGGGFAIENFKDRFPDIELPVPPGV